MSQSLVVRIKKSISRPWEIFNMEFIPGACCTPWERTCIHSVVLVVLGLIVYAISRAASKFSQNLADV
ncbi:hypothetical protein DASB73_006410 [Starmerella bacillaris]|uniref:Uncharacterized protein n=1 Tax=Starmerella bacillaris TaxID=1247836 RepID=A0AAV5RDZ8_STABA|nr:hypothetical protein DASB73_006410 [Starmerella bacillaris]